MQVPLCGRSHVHGCHLCCRSRYKGLNHIIQHCLQVQHQLPQQSLPLALCPPSRNLQSLVSILWLVGKFHLGGHREECQKAFNFNYTNGVGRMSGELVETIWSYFDYLKYQTREMGPGSRHEMLSDAMNYWNWQKLVKISKSSLVTATS